MGGDGRNMPKENNKNNDSIEFDFGMVDEEIAKKEKLVKDKKESVGDPSSAEEQARRFEEVLNNPPVRDYGRVELFSARDNAGNQFLAMPHDNGEIKAKFQDDKPVRVTLYDPLFEVDLYDLFKGQLAEAPMNVIPNLIDEKCQIVANENKDWRPEKPKRDWTSYYWVIVGISFIPMALVGVAIISGLF